MFFRNKKEDVGKFSIQLNTMEKKIIIMGEIKHHYDIHNSETDEKL